MNLPVQNRNGRVSVGPCHVAARIAATHGSGSRTRSVAWVTNHLLVSISQRCPQHNTTTPLMELEPRAIPWAW